MITRRRQDAVLGGFWEFPGGKIEPGESPQAAAVREIREETTLEVRITAALPVLHHVYDYADVELHPFVCEVVAGEARAVEAPVTKAPALDIR